MQICYKNAKRRLVTQKQKIDKLTSPSETRNYEKSCNPVTRDSSQPIMVHVGHSPG